MARAFDTYDMRSMEFRLPDLGEGLTEAEIVQWLVNVGDMVTVDQPVVEVETAKARVEVPCPYGGVVTARFGEEGTELPVGAPLLTVAEGRPVEDGPAGSGGAGGTAIRDGAGGRGRAGDGADAGASAGAGGGRLGDTGTRAERAGQGAGVAAQRSAAPAEADSSGNVLVGYGTAAGAPARRRRTGVPAVSGGTGSGQDRPAAGPRPRPAARAGGPVPVISPLVRKLARDHGLDLRELAGSGPEGLITRADVERALRAAADTRDARPDARDAAAGAAGVAEAVPGTARSVVAAGRAGRAVSGGGSAGSAGAEAASSVRVPLRGIRGAIAEKMARSRREIPEASCWVDADATELLNARAAMNRTGGPKISVLALFARICTAALARYPELNSTVDLEAHEIVRFDAVHLGFAVQTERGLMVPVVRDAHARDAESLSVECVRLTEAARAGTLTPQELTGGTFTVNNYGVFGVDGSTPIINHPEAAMLGIGRITPKPWVHQGELAVRQVVQLSLTFDHRVSDGGTAGGFLRYVADCVEQPAVLLRTL